MKPNLFSTKYLARSLLNWKQNRNHCFSTVFVSDFSFFMTDRAMLCSVLSMAAYQQLCSALVHPSSADAAKSKLVLWGLYIPEWTLKAYPHLQMLYILFPESGFSGRWWAFTSIFPVAYAVTLYVSYDIFNGKCAESKALFFQFTVTSCHSECLNKICD